MATMTFAQARKELLRMADGEYCSISFEQTLNLIDGTDKATCRVYVHGGDLITGNSWEAVLEDLRIQMAGQTVADIRKMEPRVKV